MRALAVVAAAAALLLTGCTSEPSVARSAAQSFAQAVSAQDGARACALLAPLTRQALEEQDEEPCAQALVAADLPHVDRVTSLRRHGRQAFVVLSGSGGASDTWFLSQFGDRWLVSAAGCTPRGDRPYDCDVEGP